MKNNDKKFIELLLDRCVNFEKSKSLLISYEKDNQEFVDNLVSEAKKRGIKDIYLYDEKSLEKHDVLSNVSLKDIEKEEIFDKSIWDEYARKNASFILLKTEYPNMMEDIDSNKIGKSSNVQRTSSPIYKKMQMENTIPWCITVLPNSKWAEDLFPDEENALQKLTDVLYDICLINDENPIESWNKILQDSKNKSDILNEMKIKKMHYKNSLGTDLTIELTKDAVWNSSATLDNVINNMPSYEVFTTPDYSKTNGIVYSSMPLSYNGKVVEDFYLKFKNGKVVSFDAKKGKDILKSIIETDEYSSYLGEVALINYDSPISNTNIVFKSTLLDENASCHLALGRGFNCCIKNGDAFNEEELLKHKVSISKNHVDFMIGTEDLEIIADTDEGEKQLFKDGNFCI